MVAAGPRFRLGRLWLAAAMIPVVAGAWMSPGPLRYAFMPYSPDPFSDLLTSIVPLLLVGGGIGLALRSHLRGNGTPLAIVGWLYLLIAVWLLGVTVDATSTYRPWELLLVGAAVGVSAVAAITSPTLLRGQAQPTVEGERVAVGVPAGDAVGVSPSRGEMERTEPGAATLAAERPVSAAEQGASAAEQPVAPPIERPVPSQGRVLVLASQAVLILVFGLASAAALAYAIIELLEGDLSRGQITDLLYLTILGVILAALVVGVRRWRRGRPGVLVLTNVMLLLPLSLLALAMGSGFLGGLAIQLPLVFLAGAAAVGAVGGAVVRPNPAPAPKPPAVAPPGPPAVGRGEASPPSGDAIHDPA